ncbi:DNA repair protein XRCC3 homolog [Babesia caballi]|uniref:DNA repair protein XRCC3 homolog n=1 Tax=Babesia caballi TaxID=5871 RepID=A0AAV4LZ86_BABCB|nr:DNA repair protein XRCC3 homolog [Babesia caballi]
MSASVNFARSIDDIWLTAGTAAISNRVEFGVPTIDKVFGGGIFCGKVTEVYGAAGSGKTQLALTLVAQELITTHLEGIDGVLIYLHTTGTFPIARLCEIIVEPGVPYTTPTCLILTKELIMKLSNICNGIDERRKIRLVVIDSIASVFRPSLHTKGFVSRIAKFAYAANSSVDSCIASLYQVAYLLKVLAFQKDAAVLVLNEVTSASDGAVMAIGGPSTNVRATATATNEATGEARPRRRLDRVSKLPGTATKQE